MSAFSETASNVQRAANRLARADEAAFSTDARALLSQVVAPEPTLEKAISELSEAKHIAAASLAVLRTSDELARDIVKLADTPEKDGS